MHFSYSIDNSLKSIHDCDNNDNNEIHDSNIQCGDKTVKIRAMIAVIMVVIMRMVTS